MSSRQGGGGGHWDSWHAAPRLHIGNRVQGKDAFARWDAPGLGDAAHPMTSQHVLLLEGMANHDAIEQQRTLEDQTERKARVRSQVLMQMNPTPEEKRILQAEYRETLKQQVDMKAAKKESDSSKDKELAANWQQSGAKSDKILEQESLHRENNRQVQLENEQLARMREERLMMERQFEKIEMTRCADSFINQFGRSL
eukprot:TRINITY_DN10735_c0_g1_i4.p1 TRINITY_DN10735_c0_g1~~TRINITY_DN10735_c0_g1_i4.p1  ORF type:complete len:198 (-),score=61.39 TRINITY_DN10735_c0_g1_i4:296-889(-)